MSFFDVVKHLLPRGQAWNITHDTQHRQFWEGASQSGDEVKTFIDDVYLDIFPQSTRELPAWEAQFNLLNPNALTEQERRDRLDATWKATGGQSPRYIQDTIQAAGFDVYIHEWWELPIVGARVARNPFNYLRASTNSTPEYHVECGEPDAQCGNTGIECGGIVGALGYPLVNKIFQSEPIYTILCGEDVAACGEPEAQCGNFSGFQFSLRDYFIPTDQEQWPYFLYFGAATFPDAAQVPEDRRDEFEDLLLKICPCQQWLGLIIEYV